MSEAKSKNIKEAADAWDRYQNALNKLDAAISMATVMVCGDFETYNKNIKATYAQGLSVMLEEARLVFNTAPKCFRC